MIKNHPIMVVIAGPNGAGKSTFYEKTIKDDPLFKDAPFINLDNYATEMAEADGKTVKNNDDYFLDASRKVKNDIDEQIKNKKNFVYETTSSGLSHIGIMKYAKQNGYRIATVFIGLSSAKLSYMRVQQRVNEGGHDVEPDVIMRRYPKVIKNFPLMLEQSDVAGVFDNSSKTKPFELIFLMDSRVFRTFYKYPKWLKDTVQEIRSTPNYYKYVDIHEYKNIKFPTLKNMIDKTTNTK